MNKGFYNAKLQKYLLVNSFVLVILDIIIFIALSFIYPHLREHAIHKYVNFVIFIILFTIPFIRVKIGSVVCYYFRAIITIGIIELILTILFSDAKQHIGISIAHLSNLLYLASISIGTTTLFTGKYLSTLSFEQYSKLYDEFTDNSLLRSAKCYIPMALSIYGLSLSAALAKANSYQILFLAILSIILIFIGIFLSIYNSIKSNKELLKSLQQIYIKEDTPIKCYAPDEISRYIISIKQIHSNIENMQSQLNLSIATIEKLTETISKKFITFTEYIITNKQIIEKTTESGTEFKKVYNNMFEFIKDMYGQLEYNYTHIQKALYAYKDIEEVINNVASTTKIAKQYTLAIENLKSNLSKIVRDFNEISNHIKILSINAEIEAASAGEYGERFSVIAGEIRYLAEKYSELSDSVEESLNTISDNITGLLNGITMVSTHLEQGQNELVNITDLSKTSLDALTKIQSITEELNSTIMKGMALNDKYISHMEQTATSLLKMENEIEELKEYLTDSNNSLMEMNNQDKGTEK